MNHSKLAKAVIATLVMGSIYACAFAEPADATPEQPEQPEQPVIGYKRGTVKTKCEGQLLAAHLCNATDKHLRCLELKNPGAAPVNCNVALKARMNNLGTLHLAVYTATAHSLMKAGANDWLCMSFDPILVNARQDPRIWNLQEIMEPESSCSTQDEPPPCTEEQLQGGNCTQKRQLEKYDESSPLPPGRRN